MWPTIVFLPEGAGFSTEEVANINHCIVSSVFHGIIAYRAKRAFFSLGQRLVRRRAPNHCKHHRMPQKIPGARFMHA